MSAVLPIQHFILVRGIPLWLKCANFSSVSQALSVVAMHVSRSLSSSAGVLGCIIPQDPSLLGPGLGLGLGDPRPALRLSKFVFRHTPAVVISATLPSDICVSLSDSFSLVI